MFTTSIHSELTDLVNLNTNMGRTLLFNIQF